MIVCCKTFYKSKKEDLIIKITENNRTNNIIKLTNDIRDVKIHRNLFMSRTASHFLLPFEQKI